jgi:hypothetical protein
MMGMGPQVEPAMAGRLIAKLTRPDTMAAIYPKVKDALALKWRAGGSMQALVNNVYTHNRGSREQIQWVEQVLRATPAIVPTWDALWQAPPIDPNQKQGDIAGWEPNPRILFEMLLFRSKEWIDEAVEQDTPLGKRFRKALGERDNLNAYLGHIGSGRVARLIPTLVKHFSNWRDSNGLGLGWAVTHGHSTAPLRRLIAQDGGLELVQRVEQDGKCVLDRLLGTSGWEEQRSYLTSLRRRALKNDIQRQPTAERVRHSAPKM